MAACPVRVHAWATASYWIHCQAAIIYSSTMNKNACYWLFWAFQVSTANCQTESHKQSRQAANDPLRTFRWSTAIDYLSTVGRGGY